MKDSSSWHYFSYSGGKLPKLSGKPHQGPNISLDIQKKLQQRTDFQIQIAREKNINLLVSFLYQSQPATVDPLYGLDRMQSLFDHVKNISAVHRSVPIPGTGPNPNPEQMPGPNLPRDPNSKSCIPMNSVLLCSVDGVSQNFNVQVNAYGEAQSKTRSYTLPSGYLAEVMAVEWTCNSKGTWVFSHSEGFCRLKNKPVCSPQRSVLTCSVNGAQKNISFQVNASASAGGKTNKYIPPSGYQLDIMRVEWTCQSNGTWMFSHPDGFCSLR